MPTKPISNRQGVLHLASELRAAILHYYDERAILIQGGEGPAQIVRLQHGALHRIVRSTESATPSPLAP